MAHPELNEETLTQYVLGELDPQEAAAVKEALLAHPEARRTVEELEQTIGLLNDAFAAEEAPGLETIQRDSVTLAAGVEQNRPGARRRTFGWAIAVAAAVFLVAGVTYLYNGAVRTTLTAYSSIVRESMGYQTPSVPPLEDIPLRYAGRDEGDAAASVPAPESLPAENELARQAGAAKPGTLTVGTVYEEAQDYLNEERPLVEPLDDNGTDVTLYQSYIQADEMHKGEQLKLGRVIAEIDPVVRPKNYDEHERNSIEQRTRLSQTTKSEGQSAVNSGSLQNVEEDGSIRIRANYYEFGDADTTNTEGASPPATAAEPTPEHLAQLEALGYATNAEHIKQYFFQAPREQRHAPQPGGESYDRIHENAFVAAQQQPLSTFSIDVDTASYANVRRFITSGQRPPADAVRIEELINYFEYDYRYETRDENADPFTARVAMADSPWSPGHKLVRVGIAGKTQPAADRAPSNLVFLLDVSGSMQHATKLPLLKQGLQMLVKQLGENDRVSIVVYAGSSGVVLEPTRGDNQRAILEAIERLEAGGSTNGGAGIELAYRLARQGFIKGGTNRVLLATDGDFNVGVTSQDDLVSLIEREAKSGVFLTLLGFGMGNLKDGTMEQLSNKGNGNYAYIDSLKEAKKVLVDELQANLVTIAKDVKIQVEFNPARVQSYRLIGYENRALAARDFNDDTKDAGEIGAGHSVTALYEIVPAGGAPQPGVDALKYQQQPAPVESDAPHSNELMTLKIRYKQPEGDTSKLLEFPIADTTQPFAQADDDFRFAASVAAFGMLLRNSAHSGTANWEDVGNWASSALGTDPHGYRIEFADLVRKAAALR